MHADTPARHRVAATCRPAAARPPSLPAGPGWAAAQDPIRAADLTRVPDPIRIWDWIRARAAAERPACAPHARASAARCRACTGPVRPGYTRCFQCELHAQSAPGLLADTVAPVAYAAKGSQLAQDLWRYKSDCPGSQPARAHLLSLLLVFLHDHGRRVWREAGMARPSHACVVPSGRGRPGTHPLQALVAPCLALPWVTLRPEPGGDPWARALDPGRFRAGQALPGACVLLLDDTWASGGSAQSAAVALKLAGARAVAVVVLGRHVSAAINRLDP
jgi:hypothetical protein